MDSLYDKKYEDMQNRLYRLYEEIDSLEIEMEEVGTRIQSIKQEKINADNIYKYLIFFDKLYDKFTDIEKKEFISSFVEKVEIFEKEQDDGRVLKSLKFRFPVFFDGKEVEEIGWDNDTTVETVVLMSRLEK